MAEQEAQSDTDFTFATVKTIRFGPGCVAQLGQSAASLGRKALLVTGKNFLRETGLLDRILSLLNDAAVEIVLFDEVPPEPLVDTVEHALEVCRQSLCDLVVAVGGGSVLDVGKTTAVLASADGTVRDYLTGREVMDKGLPFVAVPTTAGTGSEVTSNAVLTDRELGIKTSIRSPHMYADIAIVDPTLTIPMPPHLTAYSGMDALTQALEALVSRGANPLTDALALDATVRLIRFLPAAFENGYDLHSRTEVALGSLMGGIAFANARLGLVHGMAHPLGVLTGLPHGLICGILLPHVMRFNLPISANKYAQAARCAGLSDPSLPEHEAGESLIAKILHMCETIDIAGLSRKLRVEDEGLLASIVETTLASGSAKSNPRQATKDDVCTILSAL